MEYNAMLVVRANLVGQIERLRERPGNARLAEVCTAIDSIRHEAHRHGLTALESLSSLLESVIALHGMGPVISSYLDLMRDAALSEDQGPQSVSTYMAAMSSRMGH